MKSRESIIHALVPPEALEFLGLRGERGRETLRAFGLVIGQRGLFGLLVLVSIVFLTHLGLDMAQGTPFRPGFLRAVEGSYEYLSRLAAGDLGLSPAASLTMRAIPVAEALPAIVGRSLALLGASLVIAASLGISLGIWAAKYRNSGASLTLLLVSIAGVSIPSFFLALLFQLGVIRLTQFTGKTVLPVGGFGLDEHLILPALVLAARPLAQIMRVTYVSISESLEQDYVRTATSKGLGERLVMYRHVFRNAAVPILTSIGLSLRFSLSSLPVIEFFFGWPGVGFTLLRAISRRDINLTAALALSLGSLFILVNMLLDLSYRLIDPRLRAVRERVVPQKNESLLERARALLSGLMEALIGTTIQSWWQQRRQTTPSPDARDRAGIPRSEQPDEGEKLYKAERRRAWLGATAGNLPFMAGLVLVLALVTMFLLGAQLAPHSPFATQGLVIEDGEFSVPPFEPGESHPWGTDVLGRDMMSLILAGAQQTLLLTVLVVTARVGLGFLLGTLAGWLEGGWADRLLLGVAEVIASIPALLLAMILILALGIRQGLLPFVLALCVVGWGEVMQFVRGEVITIRPKPFIEAAVAVGLRTPRLILSHVLPNLVPTLVSLAALEAGAVLMLLGELGFIGIFIGGGAFAELDVFGAPYHYSDVPEWGSLLSNVRPYARSYPWTALYPSLAFFVAILGLNIFGEGVRRMVDRIGLGITRLVNRYTVLLALLALGAAGWARVNTGASAIYRRQAQAFDSRQALTHVATLADPGVEGRALGTPGLKSSADYIAGWFEQLGLGPAGEQSTFFQPRSRSFETLDSVPEMTIDDGGPALNYRQDYVEYPGEYRNLGQVSAPVRFLAAGDLTRTRAWGLGRYPALDEWDFSDNILLVLSDHEVTLLERAGKTSQGILVVSQDPLDLQRRSTLSAQSPFWRVYGSNRLTGQDLPILWVSESTANRMLSSAGFNLADVRRDAESLGQDEIREVALDVTASMGVAGTSHEKVSAEHVLGYWTGVSNSLYGGLNDHMVVVLAQYDSPPPGPEGKLFPAANDNASGVAVMLEVIRTMQATGYQPYRTMLFIAYSGEGFEGGAEVTPEISKFLQAKHGFSNAFQIDAVVELRGLGRAVEEDLYLSADGSQRLANLFAESARRMGVGTRRGGAEVDLSIVYEGRDVRDGGQEAPYIGLSWQGWQTTSRLESDTLESVTSQDLERAGRVISLALMALGREINY